MSDTVVLTGLSELVEALRADGRRVIGPTVRDGAVVLAELEKAEDLPYGWSVDVEGGSYRLRQGPDKVAFAHVAGPQSWKQFLNPPRKRLFSTDRDGDGFSAPVEDAESQRLAFLGVRPCDLRAIGVLGRVLGDGERYAARRANALIVAVNCTEPKATCFCVSAGGGPSVSDVTGTYDIALTELPDGRYLADAGTEAGGRLLAGVAGEPAEAGVVAAGRAAVSAAAGRMGRVLPEGDLRGLLAANLESPHWADVAERCMTCGNCTMVCPTCFCMKVTDVTDVTGEHAERWERWDSCFDLGYSYLHGGEIRSSGASRYRQWLTHKFSTWHNQFGESGCVGCGRCIVWCPVGIDVTAELAAIAGERR